MENKGIVIQVIGPVIDVKFEDKLPSIYNALHIPLGNGSKLTVEVQQHLGNNVVRTVAMDATEGLQRGMEAIDTGNVITVPVGRGVLGRILNVLGEPVDEAGPIDSEEFAPIHREAPSFEEQGTNVEVFETGIKVIDLLAP